MRALCAGSVSRLPLIRTDGLKVVSEVIIPKYILGVPLEIEDAVLG